MFRKAISLAKKAPVLRLAVALVLVLAMGIAAAQGTFQPAENNLRLAAFTLSDKEASGQIHVIEMDAASLEAIRQWPWSRTHYAEVVDQLDKAGVRSIAFDVDFSSSSTPQADARFARSLAASEAPVVLPTFGQASSYASDRTLDALPIELLRENAQLASVSIFPDPDGFIRRMPLGTVTSGTPRPSLSAFIAQAAGEIGAHFPIDYATRIDTIPRSSFIDIERGDFAPEALRGKDVLIGATAVEMGDRYAIPRYGVTPGVMIQALAAETLLRGAPGYGSFHLPLLVSLAFAIWVLGQRSILRTGAVMLFAQGIMFTAWYLAYESALLWFEIAPAMAVILSAFAIRALWIGRAALQRERMTDRETGLPNALALQRDLRDGAESFVVAALIDEYESLKVILGESEITTLFQRISERLQVATGQSAIHRTEDKVLAWQTEAPLYETEEMIAGLRAVMRSPVEISGRRIDVTLKYGVASADHPRAIANAEHAANEANRAGETWRLHEASSGEHLERQVSLMGELDEALELGHIKVFYQPKLDIKTDTITSAEALVRWDHPEKGMLPPDSFIPLAEESGRVEDLTIFVMKRAIADMQIWAKQGIVVATAINISARLLAVSSFVARAESLIDTMRVPAGQLTLEVTESAELEDAATSIATLERFKARGLAISMDDYGTGQSTLNYIKTLPLSELKIDRTFVQHAHIDRSDAMLVHSTVQLAHELGLKVVAEGIEEAACLAFLQSIGCDYAQGYFVGKPMPADALVRLVQTPCESGIAA